MEKVKKSSTVLSIVHLVVISNLDQESAFGRPTNFQPDPNSESWVRPDPIFSTFLYQYISNIQKLFRTPKTLYHYEDYRKFIEVENF